MRQEALDLLMRQEALDLLSLYITRIVMLKHT